MDNFIPLNGSPELQEEAVKQIASLQEFPIHELRFEWEENVLVLAQYDPFISPLLRVNVGLKDRKEWIRYIHISREMMKDIEFVKQIIQDEIDFAKKEYE